MCAVAASNRVPWPRSSSRSRNRSTRRNLVVSTAAPAGLASDVRATIASLDRTAVVSDISTIGGLIDEQSVQRRFETYALTGFAALALALAGAGMFSLVHYSVLQRTREIAIRMALGAARLEVMAMIVRDGMCPAAAGAIAGVAGAFGITRLLKAILFGVTPHDPLTFVAVGAVLVVLVLVACAAPAARASRTNPIVALRE